MSKDIKKPNFFIIGVGKCGTTAMSEYLREHPAVFFSTPKEPHFFNTDSNKQKKASSWSEEDYLQNCFAGSGGYQAVGEGSPSYLRSEVAVSRILEFNPQAKFIVMVRDHISLFESHYWQHIKRGRESARTPEEAWRLQEVRLKNKEEGRIGFSQTGPLYKRGLQIGKQLEKLYQKVPRSKVQVIFFEDLKENPRREYLRVLNFLELADDGRTDFPVVNKRKTLRSQTVPGMVKGLGSLKKRVGINKGFGILKALKRNNFKEVKPEPLSKEFKQELLDHFEADMDKLAELTGRDLSHWKKI